jgi:hypothetical protein
MRESKLPMMSSLTAIRRARSRKLLAAVALLAVLARALVPTGVMPVAGAGAMQLMLCDGGPGGHHHHHADGPAAPATGTAHDLCPYAMTAGGAPLPAIVGLPALQSVPQPVALATERTRILPAPLRHAAPRGPPFPA